MKFATFDYKGTTAIGIVDPAAGRAWPLAEPADMLSVVRAYEQLRGTLQPEGEGIPLAAVTLRAPFPAPLRNILCVGKNYREHAKEFTQSGFDATSKAGDHVPDDPIIFTKASNTVVGPGAPIPNHADLTKQLDYEAELAVVIGRRGRGIARAAAFDHVFGYTIANDVTARDLQLKHRQWFIGKSLDGACPMGPWVVTADEVDATALDIRCWVNDELRQDANTRDLIFDIPTLIETLSAGMTLEPGDIISTGTPAGVGIGFDPPRFLAPGDRVTIEVEGIGRLENTVE